MEAKENTNFILKTSNKTKVHHFTIYYIVSGVLLFAGAIALLAFNLTEALIYYVIGAILFFIINTLFKPMYIEFVFTNEKVVVSYYGITSIAREYHKFEFYTKQLHGFKLTNKLGGLRKDLQITVLFKNGLADYAGLSTTLLKRSQVEKISTQLQLILKENKNPNSIMH